MLPAALLCLFALGGLALLAAAITGRRGRVCERGISYAVPDRVARDPQLTERANELVAFWCGGAAIMTVPALVVISYAGSSDAHEDVFSTWGLAAFAGYALLIGMMGNYPFEKIKHI